MHKRLKFLGLKVRKFRTIVIDISCEVPSEEPLKLPKLRYMLEVEGEDLINLVERKI